MKISVFKKLNVLILTTLVVMSCQTEKELNLAVVETSRSGHKLTPVTEFESSENASTITLDPGKTYQTITGFGGAFTESSAYLLDKLSKENRK